MTWEQEIRNALVDSIDTMRLAERTLRLSGWDDLADCLRDRADKGVLILSP